MTFGSLFAGIGGFDLGFERAGLQCAWQVEIDPYCQRVLAKHWPDVPRHDDIKTFPPPDGDWSVDIICGGFPCQDISNAGKRAGITGERSGLWTEMLRVIRVVRPRFIVVENVGALLVRGMDTVLGDLAESGFDAEWQVLSAAAFGAPHIRERVFLLAYSGCSGAGHICGEDCRQGRKQTATPESTTVRQAHRPISTRRIISSGEDVPDSGRELLEVGGARDGHRRRSAIEQSLGFARDAWATESGVGRVAHGIPRRVDRLRGLGNAVVPQIAEWIGRRIIEQGEK